MDFKSKVTELALQAGGSHYPTVNRMHLDSYTKLVIESCLSAMDAGNRSHVCTNFDQAQHDASIAGAKAAIKQEFGL
jgi:hypothetical protein